MYNRQVWHVETNCSVDKESACLLCQRTLPNCVYACLLYVHVVFWIYVTFSHLFQEHEVTRMHYFLLFDTVQTCTCSIISSLNHSRAFGSGWQWLASSFIWSTTHKCFSHIHKVFDMCSISRRYAVIACAQAQTKLLDVAAVSRGICNKSYKAVGGSQLASVQRSTCALQVCEFVSRKMSSWSLCVGSSMWTMIVWFCCPLWWYSSPTRTCKPHFARSLAVCYFCMHSESSETYSMKNNESKRSLQKFCICLNFHILTLQL